MPSQQLQFFSSFYPNQYYSYPALISNDDEDAISSGASNQNKTRINYPYSHNLQVNAYPSYQTSPAYRPKSFQNKEDVRHSPEEIGQMSLLELEQQQLIPNANKFRLMLCETFVATGACIFHDSKLNLCAFAHDKRIKSDYPHQFLCDSDKEETNKERKRAVRSIVTMKQNNVSFHIHWPNLQQTPSSSKKLCEVSRYAKYHEAENLRAFKQKLIKRCVFYFWDSFMINLDMVHQLGQNDQAVENLYVQQVYDFYHTRSTTRFERRKYFSRRLPIFVQNSTTGGY